MTALLGPNFAMQNRALGMVVCAALVSASATAQNLPVLLVRVANNWGVYQPASGGGWSLKSGGGKLSTILVGEKVMANTLSPYGSDQSVTETGCEFLFQSGSEAVLQVYNNSDTEWELLHGGVILTESATKAVFARSRRVRARGTKTSGRAGGLIVPKSLTPSYSFRVTLLPNSTLFECLEGVMIVDEVEYTKGQSFSKPYP